MNWKGRWTNYRRFKSWITDSNPYAFFTLNQWFKTVPVLNISFPSFLFFPSFPIFPSFPFSPSFPFFPSFSLLINSEQKHSLQSWRGTSAWKPERIKVEHFNTFRTIFKPIFQLHGWSQYNKGIESSSQTLLLDCKNLWYFNLRLFVHKIHSLKYLRSTALGCKDIGIRIEN